MKKVIFIAASFFALVACNKEVINTLSTDVGYLLFNITSNDIVVETKALVTDVDSYKVHIGNTSYTYGTDVKNKVLTLSPATYAVYAENISATKAEEGNGALRLASESENITVAAGETTTTTLECKAVNAKISVEFTDSFKKAFVSWNVSLKYGNSDNRNLTVTETTTDANYFYNILENEQLKLNLQACVVSNDTNPKSNTQLITLQSGYHYTVKYSAGDNGFVSINVTADDQLIDADDTNVTVNPYAPNQNTNQ